MNEATRVLAPGGAVCLFVRDDEMGDNMGGKGSGNAPYSISEEEVHLHCFSKSYFRERLTQSFEEVEIVTDKGYLAVFGWSKK